jgi:class 3 adenylate cyclase
MLVCAACGQENPDGFRFCGRCAAPLAATPAREERKVVTVLFADLVGFTSRAEQLDPEDVRATLSPYYARLRSEIERHGGTVEKFIGDAVMALFGAPVTHEDDPERGVRAALAIRDGIQALSEDDGQALQVRVAVTTGEALIALDARPLEGEGMASGDVVNTAARLQSAAPVNGILVGEATYRATRDTIEYREAAPVEAKGKSEPITVWEAVAARSRFGEDVEQRQRSALVGRERELGTLVDALARCRRELAPQLTTLVGVPGIGKSRLVTELFQVVDSDPDLIWWRQGRSLPYGEGLSYWALGEIVKAQAGVLESDPTESAEEKLAAMVGDVVGEAQDAGWIAEHLRPLVGLSVTTGGGDRRSEAFAAWRNFLEALAEQRPLVLVFEDLHWADDGLLDFVDHLADWAAGVPMLIVGTARPELLDRRPDWGGGKRNAATLSISALSRDETAQLLGSLLQQILLPAELQAEVLARAEGNPLYAEEYVRMLQDHGFLTRDDRGWHLATDQELPLPETVQGMIAARLDALAPGEKELIQNAAVIGKVFWPAALEALGERAAEMHDESIHALERKEFVRRERRSAVAGELQYAFLHALVRDVAYGQIPRARRVEKHRLAAEWIASLASDRTEDRAEMLAHHYLEALRLGRAAGLDVESLRVPATDALLDVTERAQALNAWPRVSEAAQEALELVDESEPRRAGLLLALGRARYILAEPGAEILLEASELFREQGQLEAAAEAEIQLGLLFWSHGESVRSDECLARAVALVEDRPISPTKARVFAQQARAAFISGDDRLGLGLAERALPMAEQSGVDEIVSHVLNTIGMARVNLGDAAGIDDLRRSAALAEAANASEALHNALNNLANQYWRLGQLDAASATLKEARATDERFGFEGGLRWLDGEDMLDHWLRGDWNETLPRADSVIAAAATSPHYLEAPARMLRSEVLLGRGDVDGALADSERALELAREADDAQVVGPSLLYRARTLVAAGRLEDANPLLAELLRDYNLADAAQHQLPFLLAELGRGAEYLAALPDDSLSTPWIEAGRSVVSGDFGSAADIYAEIGAQAPEAQARLLKAEVLVREGRRAEADAELASALAYFRGVGANSYTRRSEALLAATA